MQSSKMNASTLWVSVVAVALLAPFAALAAGGGKPAPTTETIVGRPAKGMYCADPVAWASDKIYVWHDATPVKAQAFDIQGFLLNPATGITWRVPTTGETGSMTVADATNKVYTATPKSMGATLVGDFNYQIEYTADGKTFSGVVRRWNSKCDNCHASPPPHAVTYKATTPGVSRCRECHPLGDIMMSSHAFRVPAAEQTTSAGCYECHPGPCYSGVHLNKFPGDSIGCVTCHGTMVDAANGVMKVPGQLGFPKCQDCHTSANRQPVPYATNTGVEFKSSVGHGRVRGARGLCIVCHNSMHMEEKPQGWGDGVNNNCVKCHVDKPTAINMGPVCGNCHESSTDPHLVVK